MKRLTGKLLSVATAGILAVSAASVCGQVSQLVTLDEMGNGYISPQLPFAYSRQAEPISGITTLRYDLPFAGVAGDVLIEESPGGRLSDILRFDGQSHVWFFSDGSEGFYSLADVALLPARTTPNVTLLEQGLEGGLQYAFYIPKSSEPGYELFTSYYIISDVPEPTATIMLCCMGGGFFLLRSLRRYGKPV